MKINKIIYSIILCLMIFMTSCTYQPKSLDSEDFTVLAEKIVSGKEKGKIIDLRKVEEFEEGHILSSLSYDLTKHQVDDFYNWFIQNAGNVKKILIIDDGTNKYQEILPLLTKYKTYYYEAGYSALKTTNYFEKHIVEATGLDDCGC